MKPSFLISVPEEYFTWKTPINISDIDSFFKNLYAVLDEMNIEYTTTPVIKKMMETDGIFLSHHTYFNKPNVWNIKKGYIQNYLNFDRTGYSGWAEIADSEELFNKSQEIEKASAEMFFPIATEQYIQSGTKIRQAVDHFHLTEPYVFVAGQRPHDTVAQLSYIHTLDLMREVAEAYKNTTYKVVVKIHPLERDPKVYSFLKEYPNVIVTRASIDKIIPNCSAVYTVNSGVGFEALFYLKHVFTSGHCDYHWVTTKLNSPTDVINTMDTINQPVDELKIKKFIYYMLTEYFVNATNKDSIRKKVMTAIEEYK